MLWESVDPGHTLTKRFAFRTPCDAASWVAETLAAHWSLQVERCDRLVISGWNAMAWVVTGDGSFVAKWSAVPTKFAKLRDAAEATTFVGERGVPVAAPRPSNDGQLLVEVPNGAKGRAAGRLPFPGSRFLLGVLPVIGGDLLDVDDPAQLVDAAHTLATLHEALAAHPRRRKGQQLVHNDFRSSNLLHDGTRITAVLDFEELTHDTRAADLAKATVYLGTRYRDWGPMRPDVRQAFVAAYDEVAPLTDAERVDVDRRVAAGLRERGWS